MSTSRNPEELKKFGRDGTRFRRPCGTLRGASSISPIKAPEKLDSKTTGALWRAGYDMTPEEFSADLERLWNQVRPLYLFAAHVRALEVDGKNTAPMQFRPAAHPRASARQSWAQEWGNIYDLLRRARGQRRRQR